MRERWKPEETHTDSTIDYAISQIYDLCASVEQLQAELEKYRWIPVSERLPEKANKRPGFRFGPSIEVWITDSEFVDKGQYDYEYKTWRYGIYCMKKPTHWKLIILPEQEKVGKDMFLTQEERVIAYHKSIGDRWNEKSGCWEVDGRAEPMRKKTILGITIEETDIQIVFYPQFCVDCMLLFISKTETNPCPYCGSENLVNHNREIYKNVKNKISVQMKE